jgi:hypothetical protein
MKPYIAYALQAALFVAVILAVLAPMAYSQTGKPTQIPISSIQPTGNPGCFVSLDATGHFQCVPLPAPPAVPARLYNQIAKVLDPLAFTWTLPSLPNSATLVIYRNGLRMLPGIDYTVAGAVVTFTGGTSGQTSQPSDNIAADYNPA